MASLPSLPTELLVLIAQSLVEGPAFPALSRTGKGKERFICGQDIHSLGLVNRRLRAICEPLIFRTICPPRAPNRTHPVGPPQAVVQHCQTIILKMRQKDDFLYEGNSLSRLGVKLKNVTKIIMGASTHKMSSLTFLRRVLAAFPQAVDELVLEMEWADFRWHVWPIDARRLGHIEVRNLSMQPTECPRLRQLSECTSRLSLVAFSAPDYWDLDIDAVPPAHQMLTDLTLAGTRESQGGRRNGFDWPVVRQICRLLGRQLTHLSLEWLDTFSVDHLNAATPREEESHVASYLPSLRTLQLFFLSRSGAQQLLAALSPVRSIETLRVDALGPVPFPSPNRSLEGICPDPAQLASCVHDGGFAGLEKLRVRYSAIAPDERLETMPLTEAGLRSLRQACGDRKVGYELRMFRDDLVEMTERDF